MVCGNDDVDVFEDVFHGHLTLVGGVRDMVGTCEEVGELLEERLEVFDSMVKLSGIVEIDGVTEDGNIKILNHSNQEAYEVSVETVVKTPIKNLMLALETGVHTRLLGVTRIVGYYSRISNWNKSKIGELQDRHKGNYGVKNEVKHRYVEGDGECNGGVCSL